MISHFEKSAISDIIASKNTLDGNDAIDIEILIASIGRSLVERKGNAPLLTPALQRQPTGTFCPNWTLADMNLTPAEIESVRNSLDLKLCNLILHALKHGEVRSDFFFSEKAMTLVKNRRETLCLITLWVTEALSIML